MSPRPGSLPVAVSVLVTLCLALLAPFAAPPASATTFLPVHGWEDDVDLVVAPDGEFLVACEESEDGASARVTILNLDAVTGEAIAVSYQEVALGFENAVDPIIVPQAAPGVDGYAVCIPEESEDGTLAALVLLRLNAAGVLLARKVFLLGDLGFRPDVDGIATAYPDRLVVFFPLQSENNAVRGLLTVDIDTRDFTWGRGTLLSSDGRIAAEMNHHVTFLPGLVDAMDPVAYNTGFSARVAIPVDGVGGADLIMVDFDPGCGAGCEPPAWIGNSSVKAINAGGPNVLAFPGWERDVDIRLFGLGECGLGVLDHHILIPQEGTGDVGDLYMVDGLGNYEWAYSLVNTAPSIPGYEAGVDILTLCGLPLVVPPNRLAVPIENAAGTSADLLILNAVDGTLLARVNDPTLNPGSPVIGWEIGVEPLLWLAGGVMLAPVENAAGAALLSVGPGAVVLSTLAGGPVTGFLRSVDPIVAPLPDADRTMFVPVGVDGGANQDVLRFDAPPGLAAVQSLEVLNPGTTFQPFEWDVDVGLLRKDAPGGAYHYLAEENADGSSARLRMELTPTAATRVLVTATQSTAVLPGQLCYFRTSNGILVLCYDVLGLETGLDIVDGRGPVIAANPPAMGLTGGYDADTDPTLMWLKDLTGIPPGGGGGALRVLHANPLVFPGRIDYTLGAAGPVRIEAIDVAGRRVRGLFAGDQGAGDHAVIWDGLDDGGNPVRSGVYFVVVRSAQGMVTSKVAAVR